jgi:hypothetical protein
MSSQIAARTIRYLGAELISSDAVALHDLIRNEIDVGSPTGVEVEFEIVISESDFATALASAEVDDSEVTVEELKADSMQHVLSTAPEGLRERFGSAIAGASSMESLLRRAKET